MGITKTKKAKKLLEKKAPKGEQLAYINDKEARLLKILGGAGVNIKGTGIKSYFDDSGDDYGGYGGPSGPDGPDGPSGPDGSDYYNEVSYVAPTPAPTVSVFDDDPFQDTNPAGLSDPPETFTDSSPNPVDEVALTGNTPTTKSVFDDDPFQNTNPAGLTPGSYNPGLYNPPTYTDGPTYDEAGIFNTPTFKGPDYNDDQKALSYIEPIEEPKKGFWATAADLTKKGLVMVGEGILNAKTGGAYGKVKGTVKAAKFIDKKFNQGRGKKVLTTALTNMPTNMPKGPGVKGPPTGFNDNNNDNNETNALVAKNVIAKNVQKYSPEYKNRAIDLRDRLQPVKDRLNEKGQMTLASLNKLIETFQV
jgi:hypothetical protein